MAIYHLTAKTGSKAKGQSAGAKYVYICRDAKYAKRQDELVFRTSGHMPEWAVADPAAYWRAADEHERANGRLFKELEFALPRELSGQAQERLARRFAEHLTGSERLPYSLAIHQGDGDKPHCHLMISERMNDGLARSGGQWFRRYNGRSPETGGARKSEALKPQEWLERVRADWMAQANEALRRAGARARIDHRSLKAQGIDRRPQEKIGHAVAAMEKRGIRTRKGERALQIERENNEHHRKDQIRTVKGRVGRGGGAGGVTVGFDRGGDVAKGKGAVGVSGGLWRRFKARGAPEQPETVYRASVGVYWAVRRLLGEHSGWNSSTAGLAALARRFQLMGQQRRAAEDRARRAKMAVRPEPLSKLATRAKSNNGHPHAMEHTKPEDGPSRGRRR